LRSKRLSITLLLLLMPLTIAFAWGRTESKTTDTQGQESCTWQFAEAKEYLSKEGDGFSTSRSGNSIQTSYTYPGNLDCKDQVFQTTHTWTDPGSSLTPGQELTFDVSASWNLDGSAQCSSMVTGVNTWVMAGVTTIEAKNSHINVSTEPNGSISKQGSWVVPFGGNPGQEMTIPSSPPVATAPAITHFPCFWDTLSLIPTSKSQTILDLLDRLLSGSYPFPRNDQLPIGSIFEKLKIFFVQPIASSFPSKAATFEMFV